MHKTTLEQSVKMMATLKKAGLSGPLAMDMTHLLFTYDTTWGNDHVSFVGNDPRSARRLGVSENALIHDPNTRSTTSISNQHGAILVDSFVDVTMNIKARSDDFGVLVQNTDIVCGNGAYATTYRLEQFAVASGSETVSVESRKRSRMKVHTVFDQDKAYSKFVRETSRLASTSPVRIMYNLKDPEKTAVTLRFRASSSPFFYALSKAETNRFDDAVASGNRMNVEKMFMQALTGRNYATAGVRTMKKFDGRLTAAVSRENTASLFNNPRTLTLRSSSLHDLSEAPEGADFTLFDLAINFILHGVKEMEPENLINEENNHMVPILAVEEF